MIGHRAECAVTHGLSKACTCYGVPRSYAILRSSRWSGTTVETVIEGGLNWEAADAKRNVLTASEAELHPDQTSWTRDLFIVQMESAS